MQDYGLIIFRLVVVKRRGPGDACVRIAENKGGRKGRSRLESFSVEP